MDIEQSKTAIKEILQSLEPGEIAAARLFLVRPDMSVLSIGVGCKRCVDMCIIPHIANEIAHGGPCHSFPDIDDSVVEIFDNLFGDNAPSMGGEVH